MSMYLCSLKSNSPVYLHVYIYIEREGSGLNHRLPHRWSGPIFRILAFKEDLGPLDSSVGLGFSVCGCGFGRVWS